MQRVIFCQYEEFSQFEFLTTGAPLSRFMGDARILTGDKNSTLNTNCHTNNLPHSDVKMLPLSLSVIVIDKPGKVGAVLQTASLCYVTKSSCSSKICETTSCPNQYLRSLVSSILISKIGRNVFVTSYCDGFKHAICDFSFSYLVSSIKYLENALSRTSLAFQMSMLEKLEKLTMVIYFY